MHVLSHVLSICLMHPSSILCLSPRNNLSSSNVRRHLGKLSKWGDLGACIKWSHCLPRILRCWLWSSQTSKRGWLSWALICYICIATCTWHRIGVVASAGIRSTAIRTATTSTCTTAARTCCLNISPSQSFTGRSSSICKQNLKHKM